MIELASRCIPLPQGAVVRPFDVRREIGCTFAPEVCQDPTPAWVSREFEDGIGEALG